MLGLDALTPDDQDQIRSDIRFATIGGTVAALAMAAVLVGAGLVNRDAARFMVEAAMPSVRFLASAVMTVSATTLALMLTLLGLSSDIDGDLKKGHFQRVRQIALVDVAAFVVATVLLVIVVVPVNESSPVPATWFQGIYYAVSVASALLGGGLIAVILLLFAAIRDLIIVLSPGDDNPLVDSGAEEAEEEAEAQEAQAGEKRAEAEEKKAEEAPAN